MSKNAALLLREVAGLRHRRQRRAAVDEVLHLGVEVRAVGPHLGLQLRVAAGPWFRPGTPRRASARSARRGRRAWRTRPRRKAPCPAPSRPSGRSSRPCTWYSDLRYLSACSPFDGGPCGLHGAGEQASWSDSTATANEREDVMGGRSFERGPRESREGTAAPRDACHDGDAVRSAGAAARLGEDFGAMRAQDLPDRRSRTADPPCARSGRRARAIRGPTRACARRRRSPAAPSRPWRVARRPRRRGGLPGRAAGCGAARCRARGAVVPRRLC